MGKGMSWDLYWFLIGAGCGLLAASWWDRQRTQVERLEARHWGLAERVAKLTPEPEPGKKA